jgi:hypothetical protein
LKIASARSRASFSTRSIGDLLRDSLLAGQAAPPRPRPQGSLQLSDGPLPPAPSWHRQSALRYSPKLLAVRQSRDRIVEECEGDSGRPHVQPSRWPPMTQNCDYRDGLSIRWFPAVPPTKATSGFAGPQGIPFLPLGLRFAATRGNHGPPPRLGDGVRRGYTEMATALKPGGPVKRNRQQASDESNSRPIKSSFHTEPPLGSSVRTRPNELDWICETAAMRCAARPSPLRSAPSNRAVFLVLLIASLHGRRQQPDRGDRSLLWAIIKIFRNFS